MTLATQIYDISQRIVAIKKNDGVFDSTRHFSVVLFVIYMSKLKREQ